MKKFSLISLFLTFTCLNIQAQNVFEAYNPKYYYNNIPRYNNQFYENNFDELESYVFNRKYLRDNNLARLQRLEEQAFGAVQQGDFNTRYQNVRSAILARPKQNYRKSVLKNLSDYFAGEITGFTPPVNSYPISPYRYSNNPYYRQYQTYYSSPFGNSYRTKNYDTSSSSSVRILD